jgi:hypothetical protein
VSKKKRLLHSLLEDGKRQWYYSYKLDGRDFLDLVEKIIRKVGKYEKQLRTFFTECHLNFEHVGLLWFSVTINKEQMILDGIRNDNVRICFMDRIRGEQWFRIVILATERWSYGLLIIISSSICVHLVEEKYKKQK